MTKPTWNIAVKIRKGLRIVKRSNTWYREERVGGQPVRVSLGTSDEKEAIKKVITGQEEAARLLPQQKAPDALTLGAALEAYGEWYERNYRSAERAIPTVRCFVESVGEDADSRAVTREHVQRFVTYRTDGRRAITVRDDFARVRAFLRWIAARHDGAIVGTPWTGIEKPKDDGITKDAPSRDRIHTILRALRDHAWLGDYCTVLAETGMRPTELLGLRGIDFRGKLCSIVPWEGRLLKSKWSKRTIELNNLAAGILKVRVDRMFDKARPIFANAKGEVYKEKSIFHHFHDTLAGEIRGKVPEALKMTLYDFRHFFCSEHAAPGPQHMEIEALAAYIGHSPASTQTLLRWYTDQNALRRGAPPSLVGEPKEGKVIPIAEANK